jgi:hypothetical protein
MAANDIRIQVQMPGGTGAGPIDSGQTFQPGEPVVVDADGTIDECGSDPVTVTGIALGSSQGKDANGIAGTVANGTQISFYKPVNGQLFVTRRFATDGAGTAATPAVTSVGDTAGFILASDIWYVDTGAANVHVEIVAVLDDNGAPLGDTTVRTTGTGTQVVFGFLT